jgi:small-conductance mechanosensitive channel
MKDFIEVAESTARDPLIATFAVMALGVVAMRLLFIRHLVWRAITRVVFLIILTVLLMHDGIVPYQPLQSTGAPMSDAAAGLLKIIWWLWVAWFLVGLLRSIVVLEHRPREGKAVQDLLSGLIYLAAAFAIVAYVFELPIQGLLVTSGAIAIILGLALQSTLSDVFSGLVLSFSRPYRAGDWINLDNGTEGRVIELNWRATHILTSRRDLAIVPNSAIAKSKIVNESFPYSIHGMTVAVQLDRRMSPARGVNLLELAMLNSRSILAAPKPTVRVVSIDAAQTAFELAFFVEQLSAATAAQNDLFDLIFRHLAAGGFHLAAPRNSSNQALIEATPITERTGPENLLDLVAIFATLIPSERTAIAEKLKPASYERGEILVEPETVLHSLFIVGAGVLSATRKIGDRDTELLRLGPGDHFGEVGLLTRAETGATISALAQSIVYELPKQDLLPVLEARPQFAQELCRVLAERQAAGLAVDSIQLEKAERTGKLSIWFSDRLHRLFERSGGR